MRIDKLGIVPKTRSAIIEIDEQSLDVLYSLASKLDERDSEPTTYSQECAMRGLGYFLEAIDQLSLVDLVAFIDSLQSFSVFLERDTSNRVSSLLKFIRK